jgi:hypothetical protein
MFGCLFGHKYQAIKAIHYIDTSYVYRLSYGQYISNQDNKGVESTKALVKCTRCGILDKQIYYGYGYLTLDELNKD